MIFPWQRKDSAAKHALRAANCLREGDLANAYDEYARWAHLEPESAEASFGHAWSGLQALTAKGVAEEVVAATCVPLFERTLSLNRASPSLNALQLAAAHLSLAMFAARRGENKQAMRHHEEVIAAAPRSGHSILSRNELALGGGSGAGDLAKAERLLKEALEIDPSNEQTLHNLGVVRRQQDSFDIVFHMRAPLLLATPQHKEIVRVHPDDRLGDVAARVLSRIGLAHATGGEFIFSGDESAPYPLDSGLRQAHETLRQIGAKDRDEIMYWFANTSGVEAAARSRVVEPGGGLRAVAPTEKDGPSRASRGARGPVPPLQPVWTFGGEVAMSSPIIAGGRLYAVAADRHLYCLDSSSGTVQWRWNDASLCAHAPMFAGDRVYALVRDGICCLDAADGQVIWRQATPHPRTAVIQDQRIYVVDQAGTLRGLRTEDGQPILELRDADADTHALSSSGSLMVGASARSLWCVDLELRCMLWRMEGRFDKAVPVMAQGSIYIGTFRDGLWRVDAASGKLRWIFAADAWICSAPCVGEGRVFFGDTAGRFACVDADRGELLWTPQQWRTNRIACSVAPVLAGALVYVRLDDGVLYCLDATSGEEVWRGDADRWQRGSGSLKLAADGICYVTHQGRLALMARCTDGVAKTNAAAEQPPDRTNIPPQSTALDVDTLSVQRPPYLTAEEGHEFGLAAYYVMQDHLYEAIATLSRLGREHPDEIVVLNNLAYAYEQRGMVGDARATRDRLDTLHATSKAVVPRGVGRFLYLVGPANSNSAVNRAERPGLAATPGS
jgi:outer membrane protein assembly factor BamB/tetratricopeptide (TPR) repeat protein